MLNSIGLLFPGQGSQSVGMGRAFWEAYPSVRDLYDEANHIVGYDLGALSFEGTADKLNLTEFTQPALLVASIGALRVFEQHTLPIGAVAGHSLGEYSALVAAQGISFADAVGLVQKRGQYMAQAVPPGTGLVAAVLGMSQDIVQEVCQEAQSVGVVSAANFNCPGQVVVAGEKAAVERAGELLQLRGGRRLKTLAVSVPVHTSLMQPAADRLASVVQEILMNDLKVPLVNNAHAKAIQLASAVRASLIEQLPSPVLWQQSMETMWEMGIRTFVEVGPGTVLTGLVKRILPEAVILNVQDPSSLEVTLQRLNG